MDAKSKQMVFKKSWEEFRSTGLLWFINTTLHLFGWAIVVELEEETGKIVNAYPARVKFRGFDSKATEEEYKKLTKYIAEQGQELLAEVNED
jgi:hypothetical protein